MEAHNKKVAAKLEDGVDPVLLQLMISEPSLADKLSYFQATRVWTWGNGHCFFYGVGLRLCTDLTPEDSVNMKRLPRCTHKSDQCKRFMNNCRCMHGVCGGVMGGWVWQVLQAEGEAPQPSGS